MALFFQLDLHIPVYEVGIIFTLLSVGSIIFSLVGGALADSLGRKKTLLLGSGAGSALYFAIAIGILIRLPIPAIIAMFILTSFGGALVFPSAGALIADVTSIADRSRGYVVYRIMANLGWAIGPLTGSLIFNFGIFWIFLLVAVSSLIQGMVVLFFVRERGTYRKREKGSGRIQMISFDRFLLVFSAGTFLVTLVSSQFSVTLPLYAGVKAAVPTDLIGYIYAVNGVVVVVGQYPITNFMKRYPDIVSMMAGALAYTIGYLLVGFSTTLPQFMGDMVVITIGENLTSPIMNTVVSRIAPEGKVARYMGFLGMVNSTGRALGPSVGAFFIAIYAYNGLRIWSSVGAFGLLSIVAFMAFARMLARSFTAASAKVEGD
ncbi:MAG: MFS transporter [Candidatus Thermoplasmatota archaeon]|nr:MFS transporter [Candidatus Thermoplasmatota archaeon]